MIKSVIITSLSEANHAPFKEDLAQTVWISALDIEDESKAKKLKSRFKIPYFVEFFRDWSEEDNDSYIQNNLEKQGPTLQKVKNIIDFLKPFVESSSEHHLGVNCFAGISRSTAIGIIAWKMQGLEDRECINRIEKVRSFLWPNLRILRFADSILKSNLFNEAKAWKKEQQTLNAFITKSLDEAKK